MPRKFKLVGLLFAAMMVIGAGTASSAMAAEASLDVGLSEAFIEGTPIQLELLDHAGDPLVVRLSYSG